MAWLTANGFDCNVVESKATYNPKIGRYMSSPAIPGMSDIIGNDRFGNAVYVELKALGRKSTVSEKQWQFLTRKIETNCFAVVIDSVELLNEYYFRWRELSVIDRRYYLRNALGDKYGQEEKEN